MKLGTQRSSLWALLHGLRLAWELGICRLLVECGSPLVVLIGIFTLIFVRSFKKKLFQSPTWGSVYIALYKHGGLTYY